MGRGQAGAEATCSGRQGLGWSCTGEEADPTRDVVAGWARGQSTPEPPGGRNGVASEISTPSGF